MKIKNEVSELPDFWNGEECEYCGGEIKERRIELYRHRKNGRYLFENVPAGVCSICGTHYYSANVLKMLDRLTTAKSRQKSTVKIPVVQFV